MGFISSIFDVRMFARNLDRKQALPVKRPVVVSDIEHCAVGDLSEYMYTHVFMPMLAEGTVPLSKIDFSRIEEEDLEMLYNVFENGNFCDLLNFCTMFAAFPATPTGNKLLI